MTEQVRNSFDLTAEAYAREFAGELDRKPFDRALLGDFASSLPGGATVLDIGTGAAGHIGRFLADEGLLVTGIDLSPEAIAVARRMNPTLTFLVADARSLPLADASVDAVVAFYCFIYGTDDDVVAALAEARRVAQSGGRLLAAVHGGLDDRPRVEAFTEMLGLPVELSVRFTTPATIAGLAERAGWQIDELRVRDPYATEHQSRRIYLSATAP